MEKELIQLAGPLDSNPEFFTTKAGLKSARFKVIVNEREFDEITGMWAVAYTVHFKIVISELRFLNKVKDLKEGSFIKIEGYFEPNEYTDDEGNTKYNPEFIVVSLETFEIYSEEERIAA